ncbi:MAG: PQQ-dependent sugar dehydrogenase [Hyphomicrobiales bacterium]|nr:PQQ-dependent sugar dehydrogenase [Hyphomicrobiales bacterium]
MRLPLTRTATPSAAAALFAAAIATAVQAQPQPTVSSPAGLSVDTVAGNLAFPWSIAFLPDGRLLVTERPGRLRVVAKDGAPSPPVTGVPAVFARGQGGLHDVILDRDFVENGTIYLCFAMPVSGGGQTALARGRLVDANPPRLDAVRVIFQQEGPPSSSNHFGCRIVQAADGNLVLTTGDHFRPRDEAQNLGNHLGKVIRVTPDGRAPPDNPFVRQAGAKPEIWSYGHRNIQGAALHPQSGKLWIHEHGARGGDEINIVEPGRNYGWPVITYGVDYSGEKIGVGTRRDGMEQPVKYWVPSIAPSGMAFYTGALFPAWRGNLFIGALLAQTLVRLELKGEAVGSEERLLQNLRARIRDVRQGPDGALYLATDHSSGRILRIAPSR